ncbi:predicted protein [Postia placenta Mad-698-R]|nr:predicted protein [Postia placenta Mad-698-R]
MGGVHVAPIHLAAKYTLRRNGRCVCSLDRSMKLSHPLSNQLELIQNIQGKLEDAHMELELDDILMADAFADDDGLPLEENGCAPWGGDVRLDALDTMSLDPPDVTSPTVPPVAKTPPRHASMSDMPFDILVLILKQLHQLSRRSLFLLQDSDWDEWDDYAAFDPLRAFPAAPAAVSPAWRAAMASVSAFWTRVVVLVDDPPTPSRALADALEWSANRPLDVRVCRRVDAYDDASDPRERARVCAALALLTPHMHRWRSFSVDVLHAASLPRPYADLVGRAPLLISLLLDSVDGRAPDPEPDAPSHTDRMLYTPALRFLWLDGNTLRDAYVRPERAGALVRVMRLTVSQYRRDGVPFSVRALVYFLYALPALQSVKLHDLALDVCGSGAPLLDYQLNRLSCDRLAAPVLAEFWRLIDGYSPNHLSLKRCTFEPASMDLGSTMCLSLSDIDGDQDLAGLLDRWEGVIYPELRVRRCPGFDDALLNAMATQHNAFGRWLCAGLKSLEVYECEGYSDASLQRMIDARTMVHARSGFAAVGDEAFKVAAIEDFDSDRLRASDDGDDW